MTAAFRELPTLDREEKEWPAPTTDRSCLTSLTDAVQKYFDLMYDCDTSHFDEVFRSTVQLHGVRDGQMVMWPAQVYRDILDKRQSPKSLGSARLNEILLMDFASPDMAFVKVRVKIAAMVFVDYLTWHCIDDKWLITSKSFYIESKG